MQQQERKDRILTSAGELFAERGIAATTVRDIAARAGLLSGSLYHYFPSKVAMADRIITVYLDDLVAAYSEIVAVEKDARAALAALVHASSRVSRAHAQASEIYQRETAYLRQLPSHDDIRAAARRIREMWVGVLERGAAEGVLRADLPVDLVYLLIRDAVWLTLRSYAPADGTTAEDHATAIVSVFLDGIISPAGGDLS